jgi:hypothetical protein
MKFPILFVHGGNNGVRPRSPLDGDKQGMHGRRKDMFFKEPIFKFKLAIKLILVLIILASTPFISCIYPGIGARNKHIEGPGTLNIDNEFCSFSFDYTTSYDKDQSNGSIEDGFFYLGLFGPHAYTEPMSYVVPGGGENGRYRYRSGGIEFHAYSKKIVKLAKDSLSGWLYKWEKDIKLIDRSQINVGGITADQVIYEQLLNPGKIPRWHRDIYFDFDNVNWKFNAFADKDKPIQTSISQDFDHILNTLKLIRGVKQ